MAIIDNHPTLSYCGYKNMMVEYEGEKFAIQNSHTKHKYLYWEISNPYTLSHTDVKKPEMIGRYLLIVNERGIHTMLPYEDLKVTFDGDNLDLVVDKVLGIYETVDGFGDKFISIEQNIEGITQTVGQVQKEQNKIQEDVTQIKQSQTEIDLTVKEVVKEFGENKEMNELRENLNKSIIDFNSDLGIFKSTMLDYIKDDKISEEEKVAIETHLNNLDLRRATVVQYVTIVLNLVESNGETDKATAINSAKTRFENVVKNLITYLTTAISDGIIIPSEVSGITNVFGRCNTEINLLKNTCDDAILLGVGGSVSTELARIGLKSDEIVLSVSKTEETLKNDMSILQNNLESQIGDVNTALNDFEEVVNTTFKDGVLSEAESQMLEERIVNLDKEKGDIDKQYSELHSDVNLTDPTKSKLKEDYDTYELKHQELKEKIQEVVSDTLINDAEKLQVNTLFKEYATTLANVNASLNKAIEIITYNKSSAEIQGAKDNLQGQIEEVKNSIEDMSGIIDGTFKDNVIDEAEKISISQNLVNLSTEKKDIDNQYTELYNNTHLTGQTKIDFKASYDEYVLKYNDVVNVINGIVEKVELINNTDRANLVSALAKHDEKLALFVVQANKAIDNIATNKVNSAKSELSNNITEVTNSVTELSNTMNNSFKDSVLDEAEKLAIKQSLNTLDTEKKDIDAQYTILNENTLLEPEVLAGLKTLYDAYIVRYNDLVTQINKILELTNVIDDDIALFDSLYESHNVALVDFSKKVSECIDLIAAKRVDNSKKELEDNISGVVDSIGELEDTMNTVFKDGILSEAEKTGIKLQLKTLSSEKSDIDKQYEVVYANENLIDTHKVEFKAAYDNYILSYNALVTVINDILVKEGLIDSVDQTNLNNAFTDHDVKLGEYTKSAHKAIDAIANKISNDNASAVDKKYAEIILNPETGISSKVEHLSEKVTGEGGLEHRLQIAEEKITEEGILQVVKNSEVIQDINDKVTVNIENISKIDQKADSINLSVQGKVDANSVVSAINLSPEKIKIKANKIDITGFVTFSDLSTFGQTTIHGGNITSETITADKIEGRHLYGVSVTTRSTGIRSVLTGDGINFYSGSNGHSGKLSYDSTGAGTDEEARDRVWLRSLGGYALKIQSSGNMSVSANEGYNNIYMRANEYRLVGRLFINNKEVNPSGMVAVFG